MLGLDAPIWSWAHAMEMNSGPGMTSIAFLACKRWTFWCCWTSKIEICLHVGIKTK